MSRWFECTKCRKLTPIYEGMESKCISCNSTSGQLLTQEQVEEGIKAGVYFDVIQEGRKRDKKRR